MIETYGRIMVQNSQWDFRHFDFQKSLINYYKQGHQLNKKEINILSITISKWKNYLLIIKIIVEVSSNFAPTFLMLGVVQLEVYLRLHVHVPLLRNRKGFMFLALF